MSDNDQYEIIIIGAGPAGQTAALYAGRSRIPTLVLVQNWDKAGTLLD